MSAATRKLLLAAAIGIAAVVALLSAQPASAIYLEDRPTAMPTFVDAGYKGWGYISSGSTVTAHRWTAAGWEANTWQPGTSMWAHPFSGDWHWAYRGGAWYAVLSRSIAKWQCTTGTTTVTIRQRTAAYQYNTSGSNLYGYLGAGTQVKRLCANYFADATAASDQYWCLAIGCGPEAYVLVEARPLAGCLVPLQPDGPICMMAISDAAFPVRQVYVPARALLAPTGTLVPPPGMPVV